MLVGYTPQRHRQLYDLLMRRSRHARLWTRLRVIDHLTPSETALDYGKSLVVGSFWD